MTDNGFCKAVEILLGRMHSHPDEFYMGIAGDNYSSPWRDVANAVTIRKTGQPNWTDPPLDASICGTPLPTFTDKEVDALYARLMEVYEAGVEKEIVRRVVLSGEREQFDRYAKQGLKPAGAFINTGIALGSTGNIHNAISTGGNAPSSYAKDHIS